MNLRQCWKRSNGSAKAVTLLATLLILQIGLCFASPGEPRWFDVLFHIRPAPDRLPLGLVGAEFELCCATGLLLLVALMIRFTATSSIDEMLSSVIPKGQLREGSDPEERSRGQNPPGDEDTS